MSTKNKSYELTTIQLKKYEGFENVTEDEAKEIIFQLKELSQILFGIFSSPTKNESNEFVKENSFTNSKEKNPKCKKKNQSTKISNHESKH